MRGASHLTGVLAALVAVSCFSQSEAPASEAEQYHKPLPIDRYALVVGVQKYENLEPVENATNDAQVVGHALAKAGFKHVRVLHDPATKQEIRAAISEIAQLAGGRDQPATIVFYFAGHGFQFDGTNYLVPRRAERPVRDRNSREVDPSPLVDASIDLGSIASEFGSGRSAGATILLIDACRTEQRPSGDAPLALERSGFLPGTRVEHALVWFAAGFGAPARSQGRSNPLNSPYVSGLREYIAVPSLPLVPRLLNQVRTHVSDETGQRQKPDSEHPEQAGSYFFFQATEADRATELERWKKALALKRRKCISAFLADYRDGLLAQQAALYLARQPIAPSDAEFETACIVD